MPALDPVKIDDLIFAKTLLWRYYIDNGDLNQNKWSDNSLNNGLKDLRQIVSISK